MAKATATKSEKKDSKKQSGTHVTHIDVGDIPQYAMDSGIINIDLDSVIPDPNQPRKFFNEQELTNLAGSIVQVGIIEPILVRPVGDEQYMVVFGERRFRASKMARETNPEIQTIPAMIRILTDAEALELQITENLQRHDPHPMEEAASFGKMLETRNVEEIALRVSKSARFVANRLLLNQLIPDFQEMFFKDCMDMGTALKISRLSPDSQNELYKERVDEDWRNEEDYQLSNISWWIKKSIDLSGAPFNVEDAELYPERGACSTCPFNSKNNLLLFTEDGEGSSCSDSVCYNIKCDRNYNLKIQETLIDPSVVFIVIDQYLNDAIKHKIEMIEGAGGIVLKRGMYKEISSEKKPTLTAYRKWNTWDEDEESEDEWMKKTEREFQEELDEWTSAQNELKEARKSKKIIKAFVIDGNASGTIIEILPAIKGSDKITGNSTDAASAISGIEQREDRAKELDAEKVWASIFTLVSAERFSAVKNDNPLMDVENKALAMAMYESLEYRCREYFLEHVITLSKDQKYANKDHEYGNLGLSKAFSRITDKQMNMLSRLLMISKLFPHVGSHLKTDSNYWGKRIAELYLPDEIKAIETAQQEKADKRITRVNQRITALKNDKP